MPVSNNNVKSDDLCIKCLVSVLSAKINFLKKEVQFIPYLCLICIPAGETETEIESYSTIQQGDLRSGTRCLTGHKRVTLLSFLN